MLVKVFIKGNVENIKKQLVLSGKEDLSKCIDGNFWFDNCENPIELYKALNELDLIKDLYYCLYDVDEKEIFKPVKENNEFYELELEYNELLKFLYLSEFRTFISWNYQNKVVKCLKYVEKYEKKYNKSVLYFTEEDIQSLIQKDSPLEATNIMISLCRGMYEFMYGKDLDITPWDNFRGRIALSNKIGEKRKVSLSDVITRDFLINKLKNSYDKQAYLIALLVFEGVKFTRADEEDEMSYIKREDIFENGIKLHGKTERFLPLDKNIIDIVFMVEEMAVYKGERLIDNGYLFKTSRGWRRNDSSGRLSHITLRKKFDVFSDELSTELSVIDKITIGDMASLGKIYYAKRMILDGLKYKEAFEEVLKRFGEDVPVELHDDKEGYKIAFDRKLFRFKNAWRKYDSRGFKKFKE